MVFDIFHVGGNSFVLWVHFGRIGVHVDQPGFTTSQIHSSPRRHQRPPGMLLLREYLVLFSLFCIADKYIKRTNVETNSVLVEVQ